MNAGIDALVAGFNVPTPQMDGLGFAAQILVYAVYAAEMVSAGRLVFDGARGIAEAVRSIYHEHQAARLYEELLRNPQLFAEMSRRYLPKPDAQ